MEGNRDVTGGMGQRWECVLTYHDRDTRRSRRRYIPVPHRLMTTNEAAKGDARRYEAEAAAAWPEGVLQSPPHHMPPFVADALDEGESGLVLLTLHNTVPPAGCIASVRHSPIFEVVDFLFRQHYVPFLIWVFCLTKHPLEVVSLLSLIPYAIALNLDRHFYVSTDQFLIKVLVFCDRVCIPI